MTGVLGSGIYSGWHLEEEVIRDDEGLQPIYHTAVNVGEGTYRMLDWSPWRTMSNLEFRRMVELGFPTRADVGSGAPLNRKDLEALYNRQEADAPGGWRRCWAWLPTPLSDGSWVWRDHYWARRRNRWELTTHRVRTRWETWERWEPLDPIVQELLDSPITSLPPRQGDGKSN